MTWSYVSRTSGSNSGTFTPSSWPSGVQEGDIVVFASMIAPDTNPGYEYTCSTVGWNQQSVLGGPIRFMWARYSSAQALPTLTQGSLTTTCTWNLLVFRSTQQSGFGAQLGADSIGSNPPAASTYTTTSPSTLLVLYATVPGDTGYGWTATGGFTRLFQTNGNGSGDANFPNQWCGWQAVTPQSTTVSNMRAYLFINRYYIFAFGESDVENGFFFRV